MADDFKNTVSRTIDTTNRQYTNVVWQAGKPPLDSELNLVGQIANHNLQKTTSAVSHSGVLMNPRTADRGFEFNPLWSNFLKVKPFQALINGMVIEVEESTVKLDPPPTQDNRVDFVFLEVWKTIISAEGSGGDLSNKPVNNGTTVFSNGNTEGSGLPDEMVDSNVGFETTKRIQVQYRFRVIKAIDIYSHIEGMSSTLVYGQGPLDAPNANCVFHNQHANGDSGLWVAYMTSDGLILDPNTNTPLSNLLSENIVYGIPICAISRRNDNAYVAVATGGNQTNQNGSINRKPSSTNSTDATTLQLATLNSSLDLDFTGDVALSNGVGSGLDDDALYGSNRYLVLGSGLNREIIRVSAFNNPNVRVEARGEGGTQAKYHPAGTSVTLFNNRPDGKYADQIHRDDLFDMRHATTVGEWDYQSLLESSLSDLLFGNLRTAFKQNELNNTTAGTTIEEVSVIDSQNLAQTQAMDWPNGFRDTWSDAIVPQMGLTLYLNLNSARKADGTTEVSIDENNSANWDIAPSLNPSAFIYDGLEMKAGSWVKLTLNDDNTNLAYGVNQASGDTTPSGRGIRFIAPNEIRDTSTKRAPFTIEELGLNHAPLHYPTVESNFERPFIVLGKAKHSQTFLTSVADDPVSNNFRYLYRPTAQTRSLVVKDAQTKSSDNDLLIAVRLGGSGVDVPLVVKNLDNLVTNNGYDTSGDNSKLYAVIYGDPTTPRNNGIFKVIDILDNDGDTSNAYYFTDKTTNPRSAVEWSPTSKVGWVILKPIDNISRNGALTDSLLLNIEFRTQEISDKDDEVMVAITESTAPTYTGSDLTTLGKLHIENSVGRGEFQLSVSILYPPSTGGIANVADDIHKIGLVPDTSTGEFLNNSKSVIHGSNFDKLPLVENEIDLPTKNHVSLWNRLPSANLPIGIAQPNQMGGRIINEEADREAEAFTDEKSKTVVIRPFQNKTVIINKATSDNLTQNGVSTPLIPNTWGDGKSTDPDLTAGEEMFLTSKNAAFVLPEAIMPRFGRQDIPLHTYTGTGDQFLNGLNHIFKDKISSNSDDVFNIIGGLSNTGNPGVNNVLFVTDEGNTSWGERKQIPNIGNNKGIGARKTTLTVPTSDFGSVLNGIELPPYYGIARIYGVYERSLFNANLSQLGGHEANRFDVALNVGACPNLLRTDTSDFTMYIRQNGGTDHVNNSLYPNAHTYMLTEHAIDITRLKDKGAGWVEGSTFNSFNYVVEAVVFMFADGFISHNRYVIPRKYNGSGAPLSDRGSEKVIVDTVIPFAPPRGSHITISYKRTPYQGDPLGTIGQADQTVPQGRKNLSLLSLGTKNQQLVDLSTTNRRNLEVLASMDFYTTLGTGKIGGSVYPTTITDIGYTPFPPNRNPNILLAEDSTLTHIPLKTSTFTEGSDKKGGWSSLFLFEKPEADLFDNVVLALYKNEVSVSSITLSSINLDSDGSTKTVEEQVIGIMKWLQDLGYNNFQTRGEVRQTGTDNSSYFGLLIQAPNPTDTFELEVQWKDLRNGQEIQVFEGLRTAPLSFEMFIDDNIPEQLNYESLFNSRTHNKVSFSSVSLPPLNAGDGNTPISLTGITSRLPIGTLVRDSDFVCEDILGDRSSYLFSSTGSFSTISNPVPVNPNGIPYTSTLGVSGDTLQMNDGERYFLSNPATQIKYTISRGAGSVFGAGGENPGGPLSFLATSLNSSLKPVLKGSALAGRAMLVSNFYEETDTSNPRSYGNELQLIVVTHVIDGGNDNTITLGGDISPTGYGEGFAAADRFRIKGKPLIKNYNPQTELNIVPAPYNSN